MLRSLPRAAIALVAASAFLAACGDVETDSGEESSAESGSDGEAVCDTTDASGDLLAEVCDKGVLTVSTDPAYPPQSKYDPKTDAYEGFDIDVATEIADRLGVDVAWETPSWDVITAGSWNGRWDISVGSMTPTNDRQQVLNFTDPYYFTPAVALVHEDNTTVEDLTSDLDGANVGVCSGCTYEQFLDKTLDIRGFEFDFVVDDASIRGYDTDTTALQDLALGDGARLDAAMTSLTVAEGYVGEGNPVRVVGDPLFYEPLSVAIDKSAELDPATLTDAVGQIVQEMHEDDTLSTLSEEWYGTDLTVEQQ